MLKVGVIGTGVMGENHLRNYKSMKVDFVGVADPNERRLSEITEKYDTKGFKDYKDLLEEDLDAVSIVVPTCFHKDVAIDCSSKGIDMLVEKPISDTVENAEKMIKFAIDNEVRMTVGHIERFNPVVRFIKNAVAKDKLGKVVNIHSIRVGPHNPRIRDVGIITDLAIHDVDIMNYILESSPISVSTCGGIVCHPHSDHASIQMRYANDQSGSIETNWLTPFKIRTLTVIGTEGVIFGNCLEKKVEAHYDNSVKTYIDTEEPLKLELQNFIGCLENNEEFLVTPEQAKSNLGVVEAALKSYREKRETYVVQDCSCWNGLRWHTSGCYIC